MQDSHNETAIALDINKNLWINEGLPKLDKGIVQIPNDPLTFKTDTLVVNDARHNNLMIPNIRVALAHAHRVNGNWQFLNGQPVVETIKAYNTLNPSNRIEFVLACNQPDPGQRLDINVDDFTTQDMIASSGNEPVRITVVKNEDGQLFTYATIDGNFFGVDELKSRKDVENQINIID